MDSEDTSSPAQRTRHLLLVAYDGSAYSGFQQQQNAPSIAGHLDDALRQIDPEASKVLGSSRTDAGVHARLQPVTFDTSRKIRSRGWVLALTGLLPRNIAVLRASEVDLDFDPRKKPLWKVYRYRILRSPVEDPFLAHHAWRLGEKLDQRLMEQEARSLVGTFDFKAFRSSKDPRLDTVRTLTEVRISEATDDPRCLDLWVRGDRFLYNMVRIIAGTIVDVGRGRLPPGAALSALTGGSRLTLGMTAPARGLSLEHVELPDWGRDPWPETIPSFRPRS